MTQPRSTQNPLEDLFTERDRLFDTKQHESPEELSSTTNEGQLPPPPPPSEITNNGSPPPPPPVVKEEEIVVDFTPVDISKLTTDFSPEYAFNYFDRNSSQTITIKVLFSFYFIEN